MQLKRVLFPALLFVLRPHLTLPPPHLAQLNSAAAARSLRLAFVLTRLPLHTPHTHYTQGKAIVVLDEVIVHEPYTADAAMADKQHQTTLHRVQKVINLMRQRLGV